MPFQARPRHTLITAGLIAAMLGTAHADTTLLNVSYDPTRDLYQDINKAFAAKWKQDTGETVTIKQSHGGSGKQSQAVIAGLEADVLTLGLAPDIDDVAAKTRLLPEHWQQRLPHSSVPYYSTVAFLVRKGNPKAIRDWGDLVKPGLQVITPNPKTSASGRWNYLAAWAWALKQPGGSQQKAKAYVAELYKHVPVLDSGARGSTTTFVERGLGDVLLAWENEALLALKELGPDDYEIVTPRNNILAEPPVAWVDRNVDKHGTRKVSEAYLKFLYTPAAQDIIARNYYRPTEARAAAKYAKQYPKVTLYKVSDVFGSWPQAVTTHFADGAVFDQIRAGR
ncbi:sulfate ABC transporter substrate-binding protein [Jeongeupia wiesaeckerbachi]|uniref:sulfate ABC transporter substrate-binding protein n=1 Tax=Jeongeupia wiesaeckerbachi TaxID=3051218 RepID=UPI003D800C14